MSQKEKLLERLKRKPKDFTIDELDTLLKHCGCEKYEGGRGSGIHYIHLETKRILSFDVPHPGKELKSYHIRAALEFLKEIGIK